MPPIPLTKSTNPRGNSIRARLIGEQNYRNRYGDQNNVLPPHPKNFCRYLIIGRTGSGKTTLASKLMLAMAPRYHQIVIIAPNYEFDEPINTLHSETGKVTKIYTDIDKKTMKSFFEYMQATRKDERGLRTLIYVDDPIGNSLFTTNVNQQSYWNKFVNNIKHFRASLVFCTQMTGGASVAMRAAMDAYILYPCFQNRRCVYRACEFTTWSIFDELMTKYASRKHHGLWINIQNGGLGVFSFDADYKLSRVPEI